MRDGTMGGGADRAEAEAEFARATREIFGTSCKAAWLSGSFVYQGAKPGHSDIDVVVVLDDRVSIPADGETLERIRRFIDVYLTVHARLGLDPDLQFPAEYVVPATIEEALDWRGLALDGTVADEFPPVDNPDHWLGRPDRWFHAWLSETAFSRFLAGDRAYHEASKLAAWKTVLRFLLLRSDGRPMGLDDLWPGLAQFGVKPSYQPFWPAEQVWVERAAGALEKEGTAERVDDRIIAVREPLRQWEQQLESKIRAERSEGPLLLPPERHDEIAAYARQRWASQDLPELVESA
jgi:predicted nucleotidyltransferase